MTLTKADIINILREQIGLPKKDCLKIVNAYFEEISRGLEREEEIIDSFIKRLNAIDQNKLTNREKVTHGMLEFALSSNKDSLLDRNWEFGAGVSGFTGFLIDYNRQMFIPDSESADMMLKRLELYKRLYTQIAEVQKVGLNNNRVATERNLLRTIDQLENYLASSLDQDPLRQFLSGDFRHGNI